MSGWQGDTMACLRAAQEPAKAWGCDPRFRAERDPLRRGFWVYFDDALGSTVKLFVDEREARLRQSLDAWPS